MKKLYSFLTIVLALPLLWSCGNDNSDDPTPTPNVSIVLRSQSISERAEVDATTTTVLKLTYNTTVQVASNANITLNGSRITATSNAKTSMAVDIALTLEEGQSYTLTVPQGAIVSTADANTTAPAFTLNFTTKAKPEPPVGTISATPLTENAAARRLYTYFYEQYGQKVISSVMADVNWNHRLADKVKTLTGKYPAMNCYDFIHVYVPQNNWINYDDISPVRQWADAGGIVQLMWHFNVPVNAETTPGADGSGVTCTPSETTFKASNALKDGTWENKWFYGQMDKVIAIILKLQDAGIAATWRPFHEAAGNAILKSGASWGKAWFWWGYDGADTFKQLWVAMYDYFKQKGVDNLIWIWTTQNCNGDSNTYYQDIDWYPGDAYVDMVARDLYGYDASKNQQEFTEIQTRYPTKMVVLGECGKGDSGEQGLISDCWTKGAQWGHFMVWCQGGQGSTNTMCSDSWWKDAMSSPHVITRDQLPSLK